MHLYKRRLKIAEVQKVAGYDVIISTLVYWRAFPNKCSGLGGSPGLVVKGETRNQKVVSSNPRAGDWMDIFTFICCKNCNDCQKRQK